MMTQNFLHKLLLSIAGSVVTLLGTVDAASALYFHESMCGGDAGQLVQTACNTTSQPFGSVDNTKNRISGTLFGKVDLFKISVVDGLYEFTTVGTGGKIRDSQLFIFDSKGVALFANDDAANGVLRSTIQAQLTAGTYYIGISKYGRDPYNKAGFMFPDRYVGQHTPNARQAANYKKAARLVDWAMRKNQKSYNRQVQYNIDVQRVANVPTPALLPGLVGFGISILRKRKDAAESVVSE